MKNRTPLPKYEIGLTVTTRALLARELTERNALTDKVKRWTITEVQRRSSDKHKLVNSGKKATLRKTGTRDVVVLVLASQPEGYTKRVFWFE